MNCSLESMKHHARNCPQNKDKYWPDAQLEHDIIWEVILGSMLGILACLSQRKIPVHAHVMTWVINVLIIFNYSNEFSFEFSTVWEENKQAVVMWSWKGEKKMLNLNIYLWRVLRKEKKEFQKCWLILYEPFPVIYWLFFISWMTSLYPI